MESESWPGNMNMLPRAAIITFYLHVRAHLRLLQSTWGWRTEGCPWTPTTWTARGTLAAPEETLLRPPRCSSSPLPPPPPPLLSSASSLPPAPPLRSSPRPRLRTLATTTTAIPPPPPAAVAAAVLASRSLSGRAPMTPASSGTRPRGSSGGRGGCTTARTSSGKCRS